VNFNYASAGVLRNKNKALIQSCANTFHKISIIHSVETNSDLWRLWYWI